MNEKKSLVKLHGDLVKLGLEPVVVWLYTSALPPSYPDTFWSQHTAPKGMVWIRTPFQSCHPNRYSWNTWKCLGAKLPKQVLLAVLYLHWPHHRLSTTSLPPIILYRYNEQKHLKVLKINGLYGFSEETCMHASLLDLVLHYSEHSLKIHNKQLTTTLQFPINADK